MNIEIPYGKGVIRGSIPDQRISRVVVDHLDAYRPDKGEDALIDNAMEHPIGSPPLWELAKGKEKIVIIASDHTRPVPSKHIIPKMLAQVRQGNPHADITILIATGCHRGTTREELVEKFGEEIVSKEKIVVHDCMDYDNMVSMGTLPSGGKLSVNRLAAEADLLISEGFIEPHFFAGFSGGRKSVLPGVCSRETVHYNHNAGFISHPNSRAGILENNLIHRDMLYAARKANLAFIVNVVINSKHEVIAAFAGDCDAAHLAGAGFLKGLCCYHVPKSDIVITSNNGYPLDRNIYQAVKSMSTAEAACSDNGVIIVCASCTDGDGSRSFAETFMNEKSAAQILAEIEATPADQTVVDQWQSQILARVLSRFHVILISEADKDLVRAMKMCPASSIEEAMEIADKLLGYKGSVTVIPQGVSTIVI